MSYIKMNLLGLDYFNCEPFELNFRLHVLGGFWPLNTNIRWKQILFSIFSFLCYFSLISMIVIQVIDIYTLRNDPVGLTRDLCSISISYTIVIKSILILFRVDKINELKEKFTRFKNSRTDPDDVALLENSNKQIFSIIKTYYLMGFPCTVFWLLFPALDSAEKQIPFPYKLPVEEWTFPIYVTVYVYQAFAMAGFLINTVAVDAIFTGFILRINAHYDIIIKNVKALGNLEEKINCVTKQDEKAVRDAESNIAKDILRVNVELHKDILRDIKTLEELFTPSCIVHFAGTVTIIGTAIIDFIRVAQGLNFQIFQKLLYVAMVFWDGFIYCFFAGKLHEKSVELSLAVYGAQWYNMNTDVRRDLTFVCLKSQKAPQIKVAHLFFLNLVTFLRLMRISYDITALLFQTVRNRE